MKKFIILISTIVFLWNSSITFAQPKAKKPNMYFGLQLGKANSCDVRYDNSDARHPFNQIVNISAKSGNTWRIFFGGWFESTRNIRGDVELSGQSHDLKKITTDIDSEIAKGTLNLLNIMGNFYFDIKNESIITPFIFGGLGFSIGTLKDFSYAQWQGLHKAPSWLTLGYQVGGGLAISLTDNLLLDFSGKYFGSTEGTQKVKVIGGQDYNIKLKHGGNTSFLAGIRFLF